MKKTSLLVRGSALSLALFSAMPAIAQDASVAADDAASEADDGGVIVVTGSRILNRPNLDASIPITSVSAEDLLETGELSLGDMLNRLPQLRSTFTQANSTASIGTSGLNLLDLRGLGTGRTLVLVNGRRSVSSTPGTYRVDTNTIPTELLERVDLVTGGNSAVYGSDAVSGVVNFILKRDYDGFALNAQGGVSSRGDRGSYQISGVYGKNFADGRGNIAISGGYAHSSTLLFSDRNAQTGAFTGTPGFATVDSDIQCSLDSSGNPIPGSVAFCDPNVRGASDGIPDTAFFDVYPGSTFGNASLGGTVLFSCPAATATNAAQRALVCAPFLTPTGGRVADNYMFSPDGTLLRNNPAIDLRPFGGGVRGGRGASGHGSGSGARSAESASCSELGRADRLRRHRTDERLRREPRELGTHKVGHRAVGAHAVEAGSTGCREGDRGERERRRHVLLSGDGCRVPGDFVHTEGLGDGTQCRRGC